jgi:CheY-like chemotaxis protein
MASNPLRDRRVLIVEDEYMLAQDLCHELTDVGTVVVGPAPSIGKALDIISAGPPIDIAVVDVNLGGEMAYPVADALIARRIPFVFTTGYEDGELQTRYPQVARCEKPVDFRALTKALGQSLGP